ncbi:MULTISPECIES: Imm10 family immunity protein [unclassified Nonomuraea]|uniref:Imm10 family immunity protein n=1 Tax=unclassified Nonomuraea TaxID=2593643 RepID=UPI003409322B
MTLRFVARTAGVDEDPDEGWLVAGVAEDDDGAGMELIFQSGPDEGDDEDTHCVVTAGQGTAYGAVDEITLEDELLRVLFDPAALDDLGLPEPEVEVVLAVDAGTVERLRGALRQIMSYGRPSSRPRLVRL